MLHSYQRFQVHTVSRHTFYPWKKEGQAWTHLFASLLKSQGQRRKHQGNWPFNWTVFLLLTSRMLRGQGSLVGCSPWGQSQTRLSDWTKTTAGAGGKEPACQFRRKKSHELDPWVQKIPLDEGMATHSSILAWKIPWTEEPGGLESMESQRVWLSD